jgi:putative transposase
MARANRHYIPGFVWHITHRCHKREFLLRFRKDRHRWMQWLYQARKRYGLEILNYIVTSNHIHLLVKDTEGLGSIPRSIQLVAGRTGQEYNQRKRRQGAFWEDRYHAVAIESGEHVNDRSNGATHDRRNGAISKCPKSGFRIGSKLQIFTPFQRRVFTCSLTS